jgi:DNA-binding protein YbaB
MTTGGFDFTELLAQAQAVQQGFADAQASLEDIRIEGSAGGGLVHAVLDGQGSLVALRIAAGTPGTAGDAEDLEVLADLLVAAVRDARQQVDRVAQDRLSSATPDLGQLGAALGGLLGGMAAPSEPDTSGTPDERG